MESLEGLKRKIEGAGELASVVRTMKAMAASNIGQYEQATNALTDYYHTLELGISAWLLHQDPSVNLEVGKIKNDTDPLICAIVFGSGQGLVGQFNDVLAGTVSNTLNKLPGKKMIWSVGERMKLSLSNEGFITSQLFVVPGAVNTITSLVANILIELESYREKDKHTEFYIFHNLPVPPHFGDTEYGYKPVNQRLFPLDEKWASNFSSMKWPTNNQPQVVGGMSNTIAALIKEYLFVSLFKACAESLASENASRLQAMQRADKNIEELLEEFNYKYHHLRQLSIDEELFDVVSGFEALKKKRN